MRTGWLEDLARRHQAVAVVVVVVVVAAAVGAVGEAVLEAVENRPRRSRGFALLLLPGQNSALRYIILASNKSCRSHSPVGVLLEAMKQVPRVLESCGGRQRRVTGLPQRVSCHSLVVFHRQSINFTFLLSSFSFSPSFCPPT